MHTRPVGCHARPSRDSAYLTWYQCRGAPPTILQPVPETYHMRHSPSSTRIDGDAVRNGSTALRPRTGAADTFRKVSPPSSLTAQPTKKANGTVTPRLQPL